MRLHSAVALLSVPITLWTHHLHPLQLYVVGFVAGTAYVFFSAAEVGALPNVVAADDLTAAVSAQEVSASASGIVASPIGGLLFGLFHGLPFLVDAVSFVGSAAALSAVRTRFESSHRAEPGRHMRSDVVAGLVWLWRHPVLRPVALTAGALQVAISGVGLLVIVGARADGASATVIGVLLAAAGVGGVIGARTATWVRETLGLAPTLIAVAGTQTILWVLFAVSPTEWMTGAVLVLFAATMPFFGFAVLSYQMAQTPDELRGRVGTAFGLMTWGATPIGAAAVGLLLDHLSVTYTALVFAAWTAAMAAGSAVAIARSGQGRRVGGATRRSAPSTQTRTRVLQHPRNTNAPNSSGGPEVRTCHATAGQKPAVCKLLPEPRCCVSGLPPRPSPSVRPRMALLRCPSSEDDGLDASPSASTQLTETSANAATGELKVGPTENATSLR